MNEIDKRLVWSELLLDDGIVKQEEIFIVADYLNVPPEEVQKVADEMKQLGLITMIQE